MGIIINKTVLINSWKSEAIKVAHDKAVEIFGNLVGEVIMSTVNREYTFMIASSGSKFGWSDYDNHQSKIIELCGQLEKKGEYLDIVIVTHGTEAYGVDAKRVGGE